MERERGGVKLQVERGGFRPENYAKVAFSIQIAFSYLAI